MEVATKPAREIKEGDVVLVEGEDRRVIRIDAFSFNGELIAVQLHYFDDEGCRRLVEVPPNDALPVQQEAK